MSKSFAGFCVAFGVPILVGLRRASLAQEPAKAGTPNFSQCFITFAHLLICFPIDKSAINATYFSLLTVFSHIQTEVCWTFIANFVIKKHITFTSVKIYLGISHILKIPCNLGKKYS